MHIYMGIVSSAAALFVVGLSIQFFKVIKLKGEIARLCHENAAYAGQVAASRAERAALELEIQQTRKEAMGALAQVADVGVKLGGSEELVRGLSKDKSELCETIIQNQLQVERLQKDVSNLSLTIVEIKERNSGLILFGDQERLRLNKQITDLEFTLEGLRRDKTELDREHAALKEQESVRVERHGELTEKLNSTLEFIEDERVREREIKSAMEADRLRVSKETWARHELDVREKIAVICQRHGIDLLPKEKFPLAGKPDNAIKICGEYVIFDSKSPEGEDYGNFPTYIKRQAEAAIKYARQSDIKKDIYFVVPQDAARVIGETFLPQGTFRVHIITPDALTSVLMSIKKIEDYEYVKSISPEDRERIFTCVGKMAHGMKRSIQITQHINKEFLATLFGIENLPGDFLSDVKKVEAGLKLNPPIEGRVKAIDLGMLKDEADRVSIMTADRTLGFTTTINQSELAPLLL